MKSMSAAVRRLDSFPPLDSAEILRAIVSSRGRFTTWYSAMMSPSQDGTSRNSAWTRSSRRAAALRRRLMPLASSAAVVVAPAVCSSSFMLRLPACCRLADGTVAADLKFEVRHVGGVDVMTRLGAPDQDAGVDDRATVRRVVV